MVPTRKNLFDYVDRKAIARLASGTVSSQKPMEGNISGLHRSAHKGSSVEFSEYREFSAGDDPRRIDWRVLGRTDKCFLKEFEAETSLRCELVLDCSGSMNFGKPENKMEFAKKILMTLTYLFLNQGDAVGLKMIKETGVDELPARKNPRHLTEILNLIEKVKAVGKNNLIKSLHEIAESTRRRAMVVIISDFLEESESILQILHHLRERKHEVVLFHLFDHTELEFNFNKPMRFIDLEGESSILTDPSQIKQEYLNNLNQHIQEIRVGSAKTQCSHQVISTSDKMEEALMRFSMKQRES